MRDTLNLLDWAGSAQRGEAIEYFRGNLAEARYDLANRRKWHQAVPAGLVAACERADDAWALHERGVVHLVQRRMGRDDFAYLAVRR